MAQPTGSDLHVSRPLTNISVAYMQQGDDFIADKVFPSVPVEYQYGKYYNYTKGDWFRTESAKRAPATESVGTGWRTGTDDYSCDVFAVHKDIADQDRANQERGIFDQDRDATEFVSRDMMLRREKDWVSAYFGTGKWGLTDQTGVSGTPSTNEFKQWDQASSTPIEEIETHRVLMKQNTGFNPNRFVIGAFVYSAFKNHSQFLERIKYTQKGVVTLDLIGSLLDVESILTPNAIENTAVEGATATMAFVFGKAALLCYANPTPAKQKPSAGYVFEWNGQDGSMRGTRTKKFRMEAIASDRVEIESAYSFKMVSSDLGQYFTSAVG
jgi:hypothetical protein